MGRATIRSGSINLLNTIIGAGILAMPYGLKANGLALGLVLIVWSSLTSSFGLYLQNKVAKYTNQRGSVSYFSLAQLTYPQLSVVFDSAILIKCFGVGVSYLVVIGDLMPKIMESLGVDADSLLMHRNFWITVFMAGLVVPLSYLKKLDSLRYTSIVALASIIYLICLVIDHYFVTDYEVHPRGKVNWFVADSWKTSVAAFPVFVFAYTCHQNMFAIINELKPSDTEGSQTRQSNHIIRNAISVACILYIVVGTFGYLTFGNDVNSNIITMYPKDSTSSLIGRLCIVIMVAFSYPLQCHPCRGSVNHVIHFIIHGVDNSKMRSNRRVDGYQAIRSDSLSSSNTAVPSSVPLSTTSSNTAVHDAAHATTSDVESVAAESFVSTTPVEGAQDTDGHDPIIVPLTRKLFYIITTMINLLSYIVAISVTSLAHVLAFVGSTGSTSILFILPGLFGYLLIKPLDGRELLNGLERFCKYGGLALAIWGGVVMVVCLSATLFLGATH